MTKCINCEREILFPINEKDHIESCKKAKYFHLEHQYYGCDTGCCSHVGYLTTENGDKVYKTQFFHFGHPTYLGGNRYQSNEDFLQECLQTVLAELGIPADQIKINNDKCYITNNC